MNFFRGVMGGQPAGPQPSGAETVGNLDTVQLADGLVSKHEMANITTILFCVVLQRWRFSLHASWTAQALSHTRPHLS